MRFKRTVKEIFGFNDSLAMLSTHRFQNQYIRPAYGNVLLLVSSGSFHKTRTEQNFNQRPLG